MGYPAPQGGDNDGDENQSAPAPGGQAAGGAEQAVQMIEKGFQALGALIQKAGPQVGPDVMKLFQTAAQATDALLQDLGGPEGGGGPTPTKPQRSGPMPANANAGAKPSPY